MSEMGGATGPRRIAVLIPCYNEEQTIAQVVQQFTAQLPAAQVYVFDNDSTDHTAQKAREAGAVVRFEKRRGKGHVLRSMFLQVDADIYVMVDGDGTYPADRVHALTAPIVAGEADMVVGSRLLVEPRSRFTSLHLIGNLLFRFLVNALFHARLTDLLSGYRALNRRVVKSLPFLSRGFESETELTVKCLERGFRILEVPVTLTRRPMGSASKIHVVRDGFLILQTLLALVIDYKPLTAFGLLGLCLVGFGFVPGFVVVKEYLATGMVFRLPSAILAAGLVTGGLLVGGVGLVLNTIARRFQEVDYQMQVMLELQLGVRDTIGTPPDRGEQPPGVSSDDPTG